MRAKAEAELKRRRKRVEAVMNTVGRSQVSGGFSSKWKLYLTLKSVSNDQSVIPMGGENPESRVVKSARSTEARQDDKSSLIHALQRMG
jgi:hypothetical protein